MLERSASLGGTWRDNHYPGAECDVPSHLYSFSFEQNPNWTKKYPTQKELYTYIKSVARKYGLEEKIVYNCNLDRAEFDEAEKIWTLETSQGLMKARFLLLGNGALSSPKTPYFTGLETYKGHQFHSANWDHEFPLENKKVAVIGSAASAIQFVPKIVDKVSKLTVFQRTPNWILPRLDRPIGEAEKFILKKSPLYQNLFRSLIYLEHEIRVLGLVLSPELIPLFEKKALDHLSHQVKDPHLRKLLTPNYIMGCKRILISNDWYPAIQKHNCYLETQAIDKIYAKGVVTADGVRHEADCLIFATGFLVTDNPLNNKIIGRNRKLLGEELDSGAGAYVGTSAHNFPNLFFLSGPNTGIGHTSLIFMIEGCVNQALACIKTCEEQNKTTVEVKQSVQASYNKTLQKRLKKSVWATGCNSWYQDKNGRITSLWPGFSFEFRFHTDTFQKSNYHFS